MTDIQGLCVLIMLLMIEIIIMRSTKIISMHLEKIEVILKEKNNGER